MKKSAFRPSAVPLATVDPYFSLWSFATNLTDDSTRHWTGRRMAMTGMIRYDGETMMFMANSPALTAITANASPRCRRPAAS